MLASTNIWDISKHDPGRLYRIPLRTFIKGLDPRPRASQWMDQWKTSDPVSLFLKMSHRKNLTFLPDSVKPLRRLTQSAQKSSEAWSKQFANYLQTLVTGKIYKIECTLCMQIKKNKRKTPTFSLHAHSPMPRNVTPRNWRMRNKKVRTFNDDSTSCHHRTEARGEKPQRVSWQWSRTKLQCLSSVGRISTELPHQKESLQTAWNTLDVWQDNIKTTDYWWIN